MAKLRTLPLTYAALTLSLSTTGTTGGVCCLAFEVSLFWLLRPPPAANKLATTRTRHSRLPFALSSSYLDDLSRPSPSPPSPPNGDGNASPPNNASPNAGPPPTTTGAVTGGGTGMGGYLDRLVGEKKRAEVTEEAEAVMDKILFAQQQKAEKIPTTTNEAAGQIEDTFEYDASEQYESYLETVSAASAAQPTNAHQPTTRNGAAAAAAEAAPGPPEAAVATNESGGETETASAAAQAAPEWWSSNAAAGGAATSSSSAEHDDDMSPIVGGQEWNSGRRRTTSSSSAAGAKSPTTTPTTTPTTPAAATVAKKQDSKRIPHLWTAAAAAAAADGAADGAADAGVSGASSGLDDADADAKSEEGEGGGGGKLSMKFDPTASTTAKAEETASTASTAPSSSSSAASSSPLHPTTTTTTTTTATSATSAAPAVGPSSPVGTIEARERRPHNDNDDTTADTDTDVNESLLLTTLEQKLQQNESILSSLVTKLRTIKSQNAASTQSYQERIQLVENVRDTALKQVRELREELKVVKGEREEGTRLVAKLESKLGEIKEEEERLDEIKQEEEREEEEFAARTTEKKVAELEAKLLEVAGERNDAKKKLEEVENKRDDDYKVMKAALDRVEALEGTLEQIEKSSESVEKKKKNGNSNNGDDEDEDVDNPPPPATTEAAALAQLAAVETKLSVMESERLNEKRATRAALDRVTAVETKLGKVEAERDDARRDLEVARRARAATLGEGKLSSSAAVKSLGEEDAEREMEEARNRVSVLEEKLGAMQVSEGGGGGQVDGAEEVPSQHGREVSSALEEKLRVMEVERDEARRVAEGALQRVSALEEKLGAAESIETTTTPKKDVVETKRRNGGVGGEASSVAASDGTKDLFFAKGPPKKTRVSTVVRPPEPTNPFGWADGPNSRQREVRSPVAATAGGEGGVADTRTIEPKAIRSALERSDDLSDVDVRVLKSMLEEKEVKQQSRKKKSVKDVMRGM